MDNIRNRLLVIGVGLAFAMPALAGTETVFRRSFEYDELGRVIRVRHVDPKSDQTPATDVVVATYAYDAEGALTSATDALGRTTSMTYDALGRVVTTVDAAGKAAAFAYDADNQMIRVSDPRGLVTTYVYDGLGQLWKQTSPDSGTTSFDYDAAGLRRGMARNDGSVITFDYDGMGRLTRAIAATSERSYSYDLCTNGVGRLCVAELRENGASVSRTSHSYTPEGWLALRLDSGMDAAGETYEAAVAYAYDGLGRPTGVSYPSGLAVGYGYVNGQLATMTATINGVSHLAISNISYQPFGPIRAWTYGSGLERLIEHDKNGRAYAISAGTPAVLVQSLTYEFNRASEIVAITNGLDATQNRNYQYDPLGRLWKETVTGSEWRYDANGNRTGWIDGTVATTSYSRDEFSNRLLSSGSMSGTRHYGYDGLGNLVSQAASGSSLTYAYDGFSRLRAVTKDGVTSKYTLNALDQRASKVTTSGRSRFFYAGQNQLLAEYSSSGWKSYIWLGNELVGLVTPEQALHYVHADHLGRPESVTDGAKHVKWKARNAEYERVVVLDQIGGLNLGFPGQYYDGESGLWFNGFRDGYDASIGAYTQVDPIGLAGGSYSTYAYALGNPIKYTDPLGLDVTVCLYEGAGGFGHVGAGINTGTTAGYYPQSDAPGNPVTGTNGILRLDDPKKRQECKTIETDAEQDKRMATYMRTVAEKPGEYRLTGNNCVNFVRGLLNYGGVESSDSIKPKPFFEALPGGPKR